ncbi:USP50 [Blepharisma stoltei]|uniref:USP domain-containing protein n=1 Tax=Blepharisma stoltei TaxID=1481888 RepID=A0AAU9IM38_9CILI|nr:unnamed protein product [Blepharisma stoltei]
MSTSNLRTACYIIAAINNSSNYNKLNFQLYDKELYETIANAFRHQIRDCNLKTFHNLLGKSLSDTFEAIFQRNPTWSRYITPKIESLRLPEVSTNLKDVLFVYKRTSKMNANIYEGEYKLISSFNERQAFCLFNEQWYDCNSNRELLIKGLPDFTFPATLVYMRDKTKPLIANNVEITSEQNRRVQQLTFEIKSNGIAKRNTSAEPTSVSRNLSSSPKPLSREQNYNNMIIISEVTERRYNKEEVERGNIFRDRETSKTADSDSKIDQIIKIFNERCLDIETRLTKNFEVKLQKSLEKYKHEESLKHQQVNKTKEELFNSAVNYAQMQQEKMMNIKNELINLEKKHFGLLQILPKALNSLDGKLKEFDLKLKKLDASKINIDPEMIIKEAEVRAYNNLKAAIDQMDKKWYQEIKSIKDSKISSSANDLEIPQESNQNTKCNHLVLESDLKNEISVLNLKYETLSRNADYSIASKLEKIDQKFINIPSKQNIYENLASLQTKIESWNKATEKKLKDWEVLLLADQKLNEEKIDKLRNDLDDKIQRLENKINSKSPIEFSYSQFVPSNQFIISPQPKNSVKEFINIQDIQEGRHYISSRKAGKSLKDNHSGLFSKSGLPNIGNTCYMNSLIQIFASATEFVEYIKNCPSDKLFYSLSQLIELIQSNSDSYFIRPHIIELKNIISEEYSKHMWSSKNDAKDLFAIISDKVENRDLFTVVKNQSFTCQPFQHKIYNEDCSNLIIIPTNKQNDIEKFFKEIKEQEIYSGENQLNCASCGTLRETIMQTERIQLPNILTIYMPNYQSSGEIPSLFQIENNFYNLFGIICFNGNHFIAFTKNNENEWEKYDDSDVIKADPDWNRLYLAFYRKNN